MLSWAAKELALRLELKNYSREKGTVEPTMGRGWPRLCRAEGVWGFKSDLPPSFLPFLSSLFIYGVPTLSQALC